MDLLNILFDILQFNSTSFQIHSSNCSNNLISDESCFPLCPLYTFCKVVNQQHYGHETIFLTHGTTLCNMWHQRLSNLVTLFTNHQRVQFSLFPTYIILFINVWPISSFNKINTLSCFTCIRSYLFIQSQNIINIFC